MLPTTWVLRPALWFATAYTIVIVFHEAAHAATAMAFGFPATLFNFWVNYDFPDATARQRAAVGIAGPAVSLCVGLVSWLLSRRVKGSTAGLPLAYLAAFGVSNFFGNLMSASFVGDFSNAATVLDLSSTARFAATVTGAVGVAATLFVTGRELRRWAPPDRSRLTGALGLIVVPAVIGTVLVIVINQPTPMGPSFVTARAAEGSFWIFAAIGMLVPRHRHPAGDLSLRLSWTDGVVAVAVILIVRVMARGIALTP